MRFTGELVARLATPSLAQGNPEARRQEFLEAQDNVGKHDADPSDEMYAYRHEEETDQESETRRHIAQLNSAFKIIQIVGQIARSFAGSLKGDEKRELADVCFSLSLRLLRFGFDVFKMGQNLLGEAMKAAVR